MGARAFRRLSWLSNAFATEWVHQCMLKFIYFPWTKNHFLCAAISAIHIPTFNFDVFVFHLPETRPQVILFARTISIISPSVKMNFCATLRTIRTVSVAAKFDQKKSEYKKRQRNCDMLCVAATVASDVQSSKKMGRPSLHTYRVASIVPHHSGASRGVAAANRSRTQPLHHVLVCAI